MRERVSMAFVIITGILSYNQPLVPHGAITASRLSLPIFYSDVGKRTLHATRQRGDMGR